MNDRATRVQTFGEENAADQAWSWRNPGVATIRRDFLLPTDWLMTNQPRFTDKIINITFQLTTTNQTSKQL